MEGILQTVIWGALIQGLLLGLLYTFSQKYNSFANRLLGFFLFSLILEAATVFSPVEFIGTYSIYYYFTLPEVKLFFPLFFLHFVLEKVGRSASYRTFLRIHYGLGLALMGITLVNVLLFLFAGQTIQDFVDQATIERVYMTQQTYAFSLTIIAFGIAIKETLRYRDLVRNEYSDIAMLEIQWLWQFIFIMIPIGLLWGVELFRILLSGKSSSEIVLATWGLIILFIYFVSYKAFRHQNLFEGPLVSSLESVDAAPRPEEGEVDFDTIEKKVSEFMEAGKYYLNHDLTLHQLSKEMDVSSRLISTTINRKLGVNFSEWVNNYRVDEAMKMLTDPQFKHLSIEGLGQDAGFKSRSAMYTAFKKKTGDTPGSFRKG